VTIRELTPATWYYVRVTSRDDNNIDVSYSEVVVIQTKGKVYLVLLFPRCILLILEIIYFSFSISIR